MKKILFLCLIIWSVMETGHGQLALQGGLNVSSIRETNFIFSQESFSRIGYHLGIQYKTNLGENFKFNAGIIYSQKGAGFGSFVPTLNLNYLDIPLLFVYQKYDDQTFFAEAGPYISYLISGEDGVFDVRDNYKSADAGITIGAGYDLGTILLGGRGMIGFTNIPELNPGTTQDTRTTNITGQLYIGFQL